MKFDEVIDKSRDWDGKATYISENELFMSQDLTENEIVIRQINCSKIVDRLLRHSLQNQSKKSSQEEFSFEPDFYGETNYWFKAALPLKVIALIYLVLYIPIRLVIAVLSLLSPLS
jgi:hypothetical protein